MTGVMTPGAQERAAEMQRTWQCGCCPECEKSLCEHSLGFLEYHIAEVTAQAVQAALAKYGYHRSGCTGWFDNHMEQCNCGFREALRARPPEPAGEQG